MESIYSARMVFQVDELILIWPARSFKHVGSCWVCASMKHMKPPVQPSSRDVSLKPGRHVNLRCLEKGCWRLAGDRRNGLILSMGEWENSWYYITTGYRIIHPSLARCVTTRSLGMQYLTYLPPRRCCLTKALGGGDKPSASDPAALRAARLAALEKRGGVGAPPWYLMEDLMV